MVRPVVSPPAVRFRAWPLAALGIILALRLFYFFQLQASPISAFLVEDHLIYQQRATEILSGSLVGSAAPFYGSTLYPYLLAAVYALAGMRVSAVYLLQLLLGTTTCYLIYRLGLEIFDRRRALVALALAGLYAPFAFAEGQLVMISWTVFAVVLSLYAAARHASSGSLASAFVSGLAAGLAVGDKPNLLLLAAIVPLFWWLVYRRWRPSALAALAAGLGLVLLPILARNAAATGGRFLLSSSTGINLAIGNHAGADGTYSEPWASEGADSSQFQGLENASRFFASRALGRPADGADADAYWRRTAVSYILGNPLETLRVAGRKILLLLNRAEIPNVASFDFYRSQFVSLRLLPVGFWLVAPFAIAGAIRSAKRRDGTSLLLLFVLAYGASLLPFFICDRFRLPLVPPLVLFAADAMVGLKDDLSKRLWRKALPTIAAVGVLFGVESLPLARFDLGRDHWMMAQAYVEQNRPEGAVGHYRAALAIRPENAEIWLHLGTTLIRLDRLDEAEESLERALALAPRLADAHAALGDLHRKRGNLERAAVEYRRAAEIDPSRARDGQLRR